VGVFFYIKFISSDQTRLFSFILNNHTIENEILNANSIVHITRYNKSNKSIQITNQKGKLFWLSSIDISLSFL